MLNKRFVAFFLLVWLAPLLLLRTNGVELADFAHEMGARGHRGLVVALPLGSVLSLFSFHYNSPYFYTYQRFCGTTFHCVSK